ncbi:leucine-rich repeat-containing protein 74A-like [Branchiostoma floridae]|uniref:Leucine-rich repeat-containing protein 74A-like n=1 Tax=Branchiostoma floridae TaxID=7739 RepID=A0A9J7MQX3_BRAFL|nr:leucine-rich repeat-containing protein 74A-like [Branchiostoma floridae]
MTSYESYDYPTSADGILGRLRPRTATSSRASSALSHKQERDSTKAITAVGVANRIKSASHLKTRRARSPTDSGCSSSRQTTSPTSPGASKSRPSTGVRSQVQYWNKGHRWQTTAWDNFTSPNKETSTSTTRKSAEEKRRVQRVKGKRSSPKRRVVPSPRVSSPTHSHGSPPRGILRRSSSGRSSGRGSRLSMRTPEDEKEEDKEEDKQEDEEVPVPVVHDEDGSDTDWVVPRRSPSPTRPSTSHTHHTFSDILDITASDEEYDTDLEEDFPPPPEKPYDPTGMHRYKEQCKNDGVVPATYLMKHLGDEHLVMRHHYLGERGWRPLAMALRKNVCVRHLDLVDNHLGVEGAVAIASAVKDSPYISEMNLSENFLGHGGSAIASMLETNSDLKTLILRANQLGDHEAKTFAEALKRNITMTTLDLSQNQFGELGGIFLGAGIGANEGLNCLNLSWNHLRLKGGVAIAMGIKVNQSLEVLDLSWNGLGDLGATAFGKALRFNKTLRMLDLSNNRITVEGAKKLSLGLAKNEGLETLMLGTNAIGDEGVKALLKVLEKKNTTLKVLGLQDITVTKEVYKSIRELEDIRGIQIIHAGLGGYEKIKYVPPPSAMSILDTFVQENRMRMIDMFRQFDKDQSGDITAEEFKAGLKELGLAVDEDQLDEMITQLDTDKNGRIDYQELMTGRVIFRTEQRYKARKAAVAEKLEKERERHQLQLPTPEFRGLSL